MISVPSTPDIVCSRTTPTSMSAAFICELCDKTFELKQSLAYHKHKIHGLQLLGVGAEGVPLQMMELSEEQHQEVSPLVTRTPEMPVLFQEVTPPLNKNHKHVNVTEKGNQLEKLAQENVTSSDETSRRSRRISLASSSNIQQPRVITSSKAKHGKPVKNKKMLIMESQEKAHTVSENMEHSKNVDSETAMLEKPTFDDETAEASDTSETCRTRGYKKALPCDLCDQKFYLLVNLQSHMHEKHGAGTQRARKAIADQKVLSDQSNETPPEQNDDVFECTVCFRIFRTKAKFDEHCDKAHVSPHSSPAKSDIVQVSENAVESKKDANLEIRAPTPDPRIMCTLCSTKFRNNIGLTMHVRNVHKKLICPDCRDIFETQDELDDHLLVHELQTHTQFSTDHVQGPGKKSSISDVVSEDINHPNSSQIQCLYCYHSCIQSSQMINHVSRAHKLHACDECWDAFATKDDLIDHKKNFHSDTDPSDKIKTLELKLKTLSEESNLNLKCKVCNANFLFRNALFLHVKKYHKKETCHFCLHIFKTEELETHKTDCQLKNKSCNTNDTSKMSDHRKVGQEASPVTPAKNPLTPSKSCIYCDQKIGSFTELWSHLHAKHTTQAKYQCKICDCIFYDSKEYLTHKEWENNNTEKSKIETKQDQRIVCTGIRIESGKNIKCPICKKIFTTAWPHVRRHLVQVHKVPIYRCHQCNNTSFLEEGSLKYHISKEHPQLKVSQPFNSFSSKQSQRSETTGESAVDSAVELLKAQNVKKQANTASKDTQKMDCMYCRKTFTSSDLMSHLKNIHPTEFFCACNVCDRIFFDIDELTQHESDVHSDAGSSKVIKTEKLKHSSNHHTDRKETERSHSGSSHGSSPIDPKLKVTSQSKLHSTNSKKSSSPVKSSPENVSYKVTKSEGSSQKLAFKLRAASLPVNKPTTPTPSQKPKPLQCQFCNEVMFSAATLIGHLQQHAKNSF